MPGGKAPRPGLICRSAGPCESACAESTAPSTLRLASVVEIPWSRIDCAAEGRGAFRIGQRLFPLPLTWCWRSARRRADMESAPTADRKPRHRRTPVPAGAAPGAAEGAEREAGDKCDFAPRLPAAVVMRGRGPSIAGERRRDGRAIDARRTASHDPRICRTLRRRRKVWH